MRQDACWKLFSYLLIDRTAAQAKLNDWAREGWVLEHIYLGVFARLRATERRDLTYFLDWTDPNVREDREYIQLCADAGWEPVQTIDYLNIYASKPGASPAPIQTDPEIEYQRFRKKVLRRMAISTLMVVVLLGVYFLLINSGSHIDQILYPDATPWERFLHSFIPVFCLTFSISFFTVLLPFWLGGGFAYLLLLIRQLFLWQQALQKGEPLPGLGPWTSRIWGGLRLGAHISLSFMYFFFLLDTILNGTLNIGYGIGLLIGGGIALLISWSDQRKRRRNLLCCAFGGCLLVCIFLHGPVRMVFQGRIPSPSAAFSLDDPHPDITRMDGPFGSYGKWEFRSPDDSASRIALTARTWTSPELAQTAAEPVPRYMSPVEGTEGLWEDPIDGENSCGEFLLSRGNIWISAQYRDPELAGEVMETVLTWADTLEGGDGDEK
ncbi:MAG: DUF2812 domain-containing protein [Clostridiales bacterium]|nr:DUF2812 domain-containing protein [Clostridiales bacterium]